MNCESLNKPRLHKARATQMGETTRRAPAPAAAAMAWHAARGSSKRAGRAPPPPAATTAATRASRSASGAPRRLTRSAHAHPAVGSGAQAARAWHAARGRRAQAAVSTSMSFIFDTKVRARVTSCGRRSSETDVTPRCLLRPPVREEWEQKEAYEGTTARAGAEKGWDDKIKTRPARGRQGAGARGRGGAGARGRGGGLGPPCPRRARPPSGCGHTPAPRSRSPRGSPCLRARGVGSDCFVPAHLQRQADRHRMRHLLANQRQSVLRHEKRGKQLHEYDQIELSYQSQHGRTGRRTPLLPPRSVSTRQCHLLQFALDG
jgi:hypothetical protein